MEAVLRELDPGGHETVLHIFEGVAFPGGVISDALGNLYGTARIGGAGHYGVAYKLDPSGNFSVLYSFTGGADGANPDGGLIRNTNGNLYGTTYSGGAACASCGVVFKLDPAGNETVLHSFTGKRDGSNANGGVIRDDAGNRYGIAHNGGTAGLGVVFKLDSAGKETVLYTFTGGPGYGPVSGVAGDNSATLYGTTEFGGPANAGTVYKLDSTGFTVLYSFDGVRGKRPLGGVIHDPAGNLYGTTIGGGTAQPGSRLHAGPVRPPDRAA